MSRLVDMRLVRQQYASTPKSKEKMKPARGAFNDHNWKYLRSEKQKPNIFISTIAYVQDFWQCALCGLERQTYRTAQQHARCPNAIGVGECRNVRESILEAVLKEDG